MLWTLVGPHWRMPVISQSSSGTDILSVNIAPIPMLQKQQKAVEAFLTECSINRNEQGWFIMRHHLLRCAFPSDGMDPEDCVSWTPELNTPPPAGGAFRGMDKFFDRLSGAGWGTVAALKMFYWKFCMAIMEQLIVHKQPVDLLFCVLHIMPFRANWKQVLMQMDMAKSSKWVKVPVNYRTTAYRRQFPNNDKKSMLKRGVPDLLMDTRLQGIESRQTRLSRSVEVELTPVYWENLRYVQSLPSYPGMLRCRAEEILDKQNQILALYSAFIEESKHPFVRILGNRLPQSGKGRWCGNQNPTLRYWPIGDLDTVYGANEETESVPAAVVDEDAARVLQMPNLREAEGEQAMDGEVDVRNQRNPVVWELDNQACTG